MTPFGLSSLLVTAGCLGFGVFILLKGYNRRLNQLWALFYIEVSLWGIGGFLISLAKDPTSALILWKGTIGIGVVWIPVVFYRAICELCHLSRPKLLRVYYVTAALNSALYLTTDLFFKDARYIFGQFFWNIIGPLHPLFMAWWSFIVVHAHLELWKAFRQNRGITRGQISSIFLGGLIAYTAGLLEFLPNYHIDLYPWSNFALPFYPAIMTYGIFKYQLFDIRLVIRRSLVYSILVTLLTVGYFGLVYGIERIFQTTLGYQSAWLSLAAFALMALAFQPLKVGIQRLVDWLIFRAPQEAVVKRMERLEEGTRQMEKFKAVGTLAAGMAHEIKNPLTAIRAFSESVPELHNDPDFMKQYTEMMPGEIRRIQSLVQDLLTFSRPKTPEFKPIELGLLIHSTINLLSSELSKQHVHWTITCQHNGATFQADPDQLRQVLINLIQNAAEAMMPGGGALIITTQINDGHLELKVSDTGHGIPKELLSKIFDPFVTTKKEGNGLGLAMVYSIVQAHRGTIHAASIPGHGTTFTLRLPL